MKISTHALVSVSLLVAMAAVLHQIILFHMPQGGSVTAGCMVPLLLVSYRYGVRTGVLAGILYGVINFIQEPFVVHPIQVLFDYPLPFICLALAGIKIRDSFVVGTALGFVGRFLCHVISGVVFFADYAPEGTSPLMYSIVFNASYLIPDIIICCIILKVLPLNRILGAMK